jgi:phosphate butyryltransferase
MWYKVTAHFIFEVRVMIRSLDDFARIAGEKGPKKLAVLAPEDEEFMRAVKRSWQMGYIEPVLIGNAEKMERVADKVEFEIGGFEKIIRDDRQAIADLGIHMLFSAELDIASKGQIPTSYIYRSIIREEGKAGSGMTVSVVTFWKIPGLRHLVALTDTGVSIKPDFTTKAEILKNALFVYRLLGYPKPKIAVLSGQREIGGTLASYRDYELLREAAASGDFGDCEIIDATSFTDIFLGRNRRLADHRGVDMEQMPHILLFPCLDTGNIICKLDFFLDVTRCSLVATSRGPVCIPARSDFSDNIVEQLAMCVVVSDRMKREVK